MKKKNGAQSHEFNFINQVAYEEVLPQNTQSIIYV